MSPHTPLGFDPTMHDEHVTSGAEGDRTPGLDSAIVALSQLSYCPARLLFRRGNHSRIKQETRQSVRGVPGAVGDRPGLAEETTPARPLRPD